MKFQINKFKKIKKSQEFYERFSNYNNNNDNNDDESKTKNMKSSSSSSSSRKQQRQRRYYFYNIDLQGRLFLEETSPKNITSSIKDIKFLNFFFSKIRYATVKEIDFLIEEKEEDEEDIQYPFVSKCGFEINYIRPAATPIVFHTLINNYNDTLLYGGNLSVQFDSNRLAISKRSGKLYYPVHNDDNNNKYNEDRMKQLGYGLISSSVAVTLSDKITIGNNNNNNHDDDDKEGKFIYNNVTEIDWLPSKNEPGKWSLPDDDEDDDYI
ncbi:MAG: hypothetical protein ACI90V_003600 [Bacillariaceae sp.]|jgi:hypothetical protein